LRVMLTGAYGFLGSPILSKLTLDGVEVVTGSRNRPSSGYGLNSWKKLEIGKDEEAFLTNITEGDVLVHFAWEHLDNFESIEHYKIAQEHFDFIRRAVHRGVKRVLVAGTCLEYGRRQGEILENTPPDPEIPYAIAKDLLRRNLEALDPTESLVVQWLRIFYTYGDVNKEKTLLGQLSRAIKDNDKVFNISQADLRRDYLHVEDLATAVSLLIQHPEVSGPINCSTGSPTSITGLISSELRKSRFSISVKPGIIKPKWYEAESFWGAPEKLKRLGFRPRLVEIQ
jgi:nucleoside-diphosphate-sugar epimerase